MDIIVNINLHTGLSFLVDETGSLRGKVSVKTVIQSNASNAVNFDRSNALN